MELAHVQTFSLGAFLFSSHWSMWQIPASADCDAPTKSLRTQPKTTCILVGLLSLLYL